MLQADLLIVVAIDRVGNQYSNYANAYTHVHLCLAHISLANLPSNL